jgi:AraC family transcriptional regulator
MATYAELVNAVFSLVESRLHEPLSLEEASEKVGLSPFHLHRVVHELTGRPLIEYLRARRLAASLQDLLETNRRVVDIAMDYCFDYEQSYIRAFKRQFALTPGAYRRDRPVLDVAASLRERAWSALGENGIALSPRTVMIPGYRAVGLRRDFSADSGEDAATLLANEAWAAIDRSLGQVFASSRFTGIVSQTGDSGSWRYEAGFEVSVPVTEAERAGLASFSIPSGRYVSFSWVIRSHPSALRGSELWEFYRLVFDGFVPSSVNRFPHPWHLEHIDLAECSEDFGIFRLAVPVVETT